MNQFNIPEFNWECGLWILVLVPHLSIQQYAYLVNYSLYVLTFSNVIYIIILTNMYCKL